LFGILVKPLVTLVMKKIQSVLWVILLLSFTTGRVFAFSVEIFNTGVETADDDVGGWFQGITGYHGYIFFHRYFVSDNRKHCSLVRVSPEREVAVSGVKYTESSESHSHGGDHMIDGYGRIHTIYGGAPTHGGFLRPLPFSIGDSPGCYR
jgi:hypothetical protein